MTESEITEWLGYTDEMVNGRKLKPEIVTGMADVEVPTDNGDLEQIKAFRAFLQCSKRRVSVFIDE
jgi:hypothetical protein